MLPHKCNTIVLLFAFIEIQFHNFTSCANFKIFSLVILNKLSLDNYSLS